MVSRVLANEIYCGNEKYPPIITETQYRVVEKFRQRKAQTYSTVLQPFRQDMQCGCCGERLYWRPKTETMVLPPMWNVDETHPRKRIV